MRGDTGWELAEVAGVSLGHLALLALGTIWLGRAGFNLFGPSFPLPCLKMSIGLQRSL